MDDFLLPTDEQASLMNEEYKAKMEKVTPFFEKKFVYPIPVYLINEAEEYIDCHNHMLSYLGMLSNEDYGKKCFDSLQLVKQILSKNSILVANICNIKTTKQDYVVAKQNTRQYLYNLLYLQGKALKCLYNLRENSGGTLFEKIISDELISSVTMHGICL